MKVEFDVVMTTGKIYDYMLKHAFSTKQGIASEFAGLAILVLFFITGYLLLFCIGMLAMIYMPITLYLNAKKQMEQMPAFSERIHYIVDERGIAIIAGGRKQFQPWNSFYKVVSTNKSIIVYTDTVNACILPKEDMGNSTKIVVRFINNYMPKNKVHLSQWI